MSIKILIKITKNDNSDTGKESCISFDDHEIKKQTINLKEQIVLNEYVLVESYHSLYEELQEATAEDGSTPCPECLYEAMINAACGCPDVLVEAEYKGRKVKLNKRLPGDVKKSKVYVKGCGKDKDRIKKINFGDKKMKIKKSNPKRRKSFRARHKCATAKDKCTARYWSCKAW